jgi:hypothetical protein
MLMGGEMRANQARHRNLFFKTTLPFQIEAIDVFP